MNIKRKLSLALSTFKSYLGLLIGVAYLIGCGFMMVYIYKTPDRAASETRVEYLEYVIKNTKDQTVKDELDVLMAQAKSDGVFTNNEFEVVLKKHKSYLSNDGVSNEIRIKKLKGDEQ